LKKNVGTVLLPDPPPGESRKVTISLSLTAHLQGLIDNVAWPGTEIDLNNPGEILVLTNPSHDVSCLFQYGTAADQEQIALFAKINPFSIT
jgi:alkyl hydroperoxide reductase subunit AhpF